MPFFEFEALSAVDLAPGVRIRLVPAERMTLVFFNIDPGARIPEHAHPHEQVGMVLKGALRLTIETEERKVLPGGIYRVPPNRSHKGIALEEGAEVIEIFSPPREDFLEKFRS